VVLTVRPDRKRLAPADKTLLVYDWQQSPCQGFGKSIDLGQPEAALKVRALNVRLYLGIRGDGLGAIIASDR